MKYPKKRKSEQSYEWALEQMKEPVTYPQRCRACTAAFYKLGDIAKEHHTPELVTAALRTGRARVSEVPANMADLLTRELCLEAVKAEPENILDTPTHIADASFLREAVSIAPNSYPYAKKRMGSRTDGYSREEIELAKESVFPVKWTENYFEEYDPEAFQRRYNMEKPALETEDELFDFFVKEHSNYTFADLPRKMLFDAMNALLALYPTEHEGHTSHDLARKLLSLPEKPLYAEADLRDCSTSLEPWDAVVAEATVTDKNGDSKEAIVISFDDLFSRGCESEEDEEDAEEEVCPECGAYLVMDSDGEDDGYGELRMGWTCSGCGVTGSAFFDTTDGNRFLYHEVDE